MFTNTQDGSERLAAWRTVRNKYAGSPEELVKQFGNIKQKTRYIDYYTPENWPTPFEIVQEGWFCPSGICLVLAATLKHLGFINSEFIRFDVISNHITGQDGLVLIDGDKCYNFMPGEIVTLDYVKENGTSFESHIIATDKFFT